MTPPEQDDKSPGPLPVRAGIFIAVTATIGVAVTAAALLHWHSSDPLRFCCFLLVALLVSGFKVYLPGIDGSMSVSFVFILLGILELSFPETLVIGCASSLVQCLWHAKHGRTSVKIIFNVFSMMAPAIAISFYTYHLPQSVLHHNTALLLAATACAYFLSNTVPIALVISLTTGKAFRNTWADCYFWSFPYYFVAASIAGLVRGDRYTGWATSLLVLPVVYWFYRSYRAYLGRLEHEKQATTDYLTELPNSRSLFLHLDRELARSRRTNSPLAVMVCDLDGFKLVNDRYGHLEGNKVLVAFAQSIKAICREYDYVARMGGDEFVIIVPGLTVEAAAIG